jgi:hypothetical protein
VKKTDLIKFRCTPAFKAQLVREATYRGVSLSELCEEQLAPLTSAPTITKRKGWVYPTAEVSAQTAAAHAKVSPPAVLEAEKRAEAQQLAQITFKTAPLTTCPHGRPLKACWECA